ncbi:MAG: uracil-DNA glycosylase family protein [Anaerolineales bacterium]
MPQHATLAALQERIRACRRCAEAGYPVGEPPIFSGPATAQAMIIGQAPGYTEMTHQRPFNFTSGTRLFKWLAQAGWAEDDFRARHYMASVTRCYPGKHASGRGDRVPTREEQDLCAEWRAAELALLDLKLIIPVGKLAIGLYYNVKQPLKAIIGTTKTVGGVHIVPLPHPSGASTWHMQAANQALIDDAIGHLRHIRAEYNL